jgi:hypothetical protein
LEITPALQLGLKKYETIPMQKAFAGAPDGAYGYGWMTDEPNRAVRGALATCQHESSRACRVIDVNGQSYQDAYVKFAVDSQKALANMSLPKSPSYDLETTDWHVIPPTQLRTRAEGYHAPTPMTLTGVKTIDTAELAKRIRNGSITLIGTRGWTDGSTPIMTIPNSYYVDWGGTEEGEQRGMEVTLRANFARVMQLIAGSIRYRVSGSAESINFSH